MKAPINSYINYLLSLVAIILFTGCQTIHRNGHFIDSDITGTIKNNKFTKEQVLDLVGTPEIISETNPNKWYYIQRITASRIWLQPKVLEQKIAEVMFDQNNVVSSVTIIDNSNIENLKTTNDYTKTKGNDMNPLQTYIKNMGRFNKKNIKKPKG